MPTCELAMQTTRTTFCHKLVQQYESQGEELDRVALARDEDSFLFFPFLPFPCLHGSVLFSLRTGESTETARASGLEFRTDRIRSDRSEITVGAVSVPCVKSDRRIGASPFGSTAILSQVPSPFVSNLSFSSELFQSGSYEQLTSWIFELFFELSYALRVFVTFHSRFCEPFFKRKFGVPFESNLRGAHRARGAGGGGPRGIREKRKAEREWKWKWNSAQRTYEFTTQKGYEDTEKRRGTIPSLAVIELPKCLHLF